MASWDVLPLVSLAQKAAFAPQFYIPDILQLMQEKQKIYQYALAGEKFGMKDRVGQTFAINISDAVGTQAYTVGTLGPGTKIPLTNLKSYTVYGTINEYGIGAKMEKFLLNVSPSDIEGQMVRVQLAQTLVDQLDSLVRDEALRATTNRCNGGTYAQTTGNITFGTYANGKLTLSSLQRVQVRKFINNVDVPIPFYIHPLQWKDIINETATGGFVGVAQYADKGFDKIFSAEIGDLYGLRIVITNRVVGTKESDSTGTVQTADAFGFVPNSSIGMFYASAPEIRYEPNYDTDFERTSALAVYWQGCAKLLKDRECFRLHTTVDSDITASAL